MKKMPTPRYRAIKRLLALTLIAVALLSLSSCSKEPYDYDLSQHIKIGDYTKISITHDSALERMQEYKETLIATHAKLSDTPISDRTLKKGDVVTVSYKCYLEEDRLMPIEGEPTPVLEDKDCQIILGRGKYPQQFETAILSNGHPTASLEVHIHLPSDFGISTLAGKNVVFLIHVTGAHELILPEFTDSFVKEHTIYSTVEEYERETVVQAYYDLIWEALVESSEIISYPYEEQNEHTLDFIEHYTNLANARDMTLENYIKTKFFMDSQHFHLKADEFAKAYTKEELMVYRLARSNSLMLIEGEYEQRAQKYVEKHKLSTLSELEQTFPHSFISYTVLKDKIKEFVAQNSFTEFEN